MKYVYFVHYSVQSRYTQEYNPRQYNSKITIDALPGTWAVVDEIIKKIREQHPHDEFVINNFILVETIREFCKNCPHPRESHENRPDGEVGCKECSCMKYKPAI